MQNHVEEKVKKIIANQIGVSEEEITLDSYLHDDLNADPLTTADLVVSLEDEFKISILPEDSGKFEKVSDIVNFVADSIGEV